MVHGIAEGLFVLREWSPRNIPAENTIVFCISHLHQDSFLVRNDGKQTRPDWSTRHFLDCLWNCWLINKAFFRWSVELHFQNFHQRDREYMVEAVQFVCMARDRVAWKWTPTFLKPHVLGGHTGLLPSSLAPSDMQTDRLHVHRSIASSTVSQSMESLASGLALPCLTHAVRLRCHTSIDCAFCPQNIFHQLYVRVLLLQWTETFSLATWWEADRTKETTAAVKVTHFQMK